MKNVVRLLGVLFMTVLVFASCSKDDDPTDNDLFVGTYNGSVSYLSSEEGSELISNNQGWVRLVKVGGDNYNFTFSNNIPALSITMKKGDNNTLIFEDSEIGYVRINAGKLTIAYSKDGSTWTADTTRE